MSVDRTGTMPASHEHIAIAVSKYVNDWHVQYTARPTELVAAGIVTAFMQDKILNQRAGHMLDENHRRFRFDYGRSPVDSEASAQSGRAVK
jgi:hypothetical protein